MTFTPEMLALAGGIFLLRVINYSISTLRMVAITRGKRALSASMAFVEAFLFAVVMASVVTDLDNVANLLAYCLGAAVGSYLGMILERRFITSYSSVNVITRHHAEAITSALRENGYGVTETIGQGRDGEVSIIHSSASNRDVPHMLRVIRAVHPDAFVEIGQASTLQRGWLPGGVPRR